MMIAIALLLAPIQIAAPTPAPAPAPAPAPTPAAAAPVEAIVNQRDWIGTLTVPSGATLRIAVHIAAGADGTLAGTLDSLDQNANGTRLAGIERSATALRFDVPDNGGRYAGRWDAATRSWTGTWYQSGLELPLVLKAGGPPPARQAEWVLPGDAAIGAMLDERIAKRPGAGIVVGVIDAGGRRIVARGPAGAAPFDGRTLFEIGSMTKVFTGLLLADMVERGEVRLDDPAAKYLPQGATLPARGRAITLLDLATHRSGLPRLPLNMPFGDADDPYADYTPAMMLDFLKDYRLERDVDSKFEYSNLGVGLLGYLLAARAGTDYDTLVRTRITSPLHMDDTRIALSPDRQRRIATPHDGYMRPGKPWRMGALVAAGGLKSDAGDMLDFLAANMAAQAPAPKPAPALAAAMAQMQVVRRAGDGPRTDMGIGWMIVRTPGGRIVMHDGATGGYTSTMAFDPVRRRGVVVLTNSAVQPGATDIGLHILTGSPLSSTTAPPGSPTLSDRSEITVPPTELDRFVGRYRYGPTGVMTITRPGDRLVAQLTGQMALPVFASGPLDFFWKAVDARMTFAVTDGRVVALTLHQDGKDITMPRIAD